MADETVLKLVKVNEREKKVDQYNRYGRRLGVKTVKEHDLELHHPDTGEPIFSVTPGHKRGHYDIDWHPYMKDTHPELASGFEHGKKRHDSYSHFKSESGKDYLGTQWGRHYDAAARTGFKDSLPHTIEPKPTEEYPHGHSVHFHDPDTGDRIASVHHTSGYDNKITYSGEYLKKHDIHPDVAKAAGGAGAYNLAKKIHSEKGKSYSLVGKSLHGIAHSTYQRGYSYTASAHTKVYTAGRQDMSDEELSSVHEKHLASDGKTTVTRLSPTVFKAERGDVRIHSIAHGGEVHHHQFSHDDGSTNGKNTEKIV